MLWRHAWHCRIFENAAIQEFHDVEVSTNDVAILTEAVGFWDWDVGLLKRVDDSVLAVDLVGSLRQQLAWRLLPHHILLARRICYLVCRVRLAISKLAVSREQRHFNLDPDIKHTCLTSIGVLMSGTLAPT